MQLVVKGRNTEVSETIHSYIEKKLGKLDHYLDLIDEVEIEVTEGKTKSRGERFVVQATALVNGTIIRAEEGNGNVRVAVDAVTHTMVQQIKRFKDKLYTRGKSGPSIRVGEQVGPATFEEEGEEVESGKVVKIKRFPIKPMDTAEAAEQMELLGHDFFLYLNADTEKYAVVYRRADGHYGVIEPEPK